MNFDWLTRLQVKCREEAGLDFAFYVFGTFGIVLNVMKILSLLRAKISSVMRSGFQDILL